MRLRTTVAFGAMLATFSQSAAAYRPFDGTDADVAEYGELELELGPVGYLRAMHTANLVAPAVVLNVGFLPGWELVMQGSGMFAMGMPSRFADGGVFLKHLLREGTLQGKSGIGLATELGMLLPGINDGADSNDAGVYLGFIASYAWRDLVVHLNVNMARTQDGHGNLFTGLILEGVPWARVRPVAEIYVDNGDTTTPSVLVGFIARANKHVSFDSAVRLAWSSAAVFEVRAGLTWTLGN